MQAQNLKQFVSDHVAGTMATATMFGAAIGVASVLAIGAFVSNGAPAIGSIQVDRSALTITGAGPGSQGIVTRSGEIAGPGEGLNAAFGPESVATIDQRAMTIAPDAGARVAGPGEGLNEYNQTAALSTAAERPYGPGEGLNETGFAAAGTVTEGGAIGADSRGVALGSGTLVGPGEGLNEIAQFVAPSVTVERQFGPGEGLMEIGGAAAPSVTVERPYGPGEGLMESGFAITDGAAGASQSGADSRGVVREPGALVGPGEGLNEISQGAVPSQTDERPYGPGEGLISSGQ